MPAFQTAEAMDELCRQFLEAWNTDKIDRLLLIPMFILDFLCIHPFNDGNGRMSRLLSLLLYYKAGYIVGKYVSMEMLIEKQRKLTMKHCRQVRQDGMKMRTAMSLLLSIIWVSC